MNTQLISEYPARERMPARPSTVELNTWYQGYETGMAFCRLTRALSLEPGTKSEKEQRCLEQTLSRHVAHLSGCRDLTLVDLGTGDGQKMLMVIDALVGAGVSSIRYLPVDTNPYISRYAILNILGGGKLAWSAEDAERLFGPLLEDDGGVTADEHAISLESLVYLSRFCASGDVRVGSVLTVPLAGADVDFFQNFSDVVCLAKRLKPRLRAFCLLGNTFGNYPAPERDAFLGAVHAGMEPGDVFLLGVAVRPGAGPAYADEVRMLEHEYQAGEAFMRPGADDPASTFHSRFDPASHCMIHTFERPDATVQHMGYSVLFDPETLTRDLTATGFEVLAQELYPPVEAKAPGCLTLIARKPLTTAEAIEERR